ncbi:SDR family oxidoreductase [Aurantivibrio plasticivorans]
MSEILSLEGKVALITGAGRGVGEQIAKHFADHNAKAIIVNDYFLDRAEAVAKEINDAGGNALAIQCDVTNLDSVKTMVEHAKEKFGSIDILVNNAGNAGAEPDPDARKPFWETSPEAWNSFIQVNFYGVINTSTAVIPDMIEKKSGRIITIISDAGRVGETGLEVYSGAKAGAAGFIRAIARSLGRYSINCNSVAIAATLTPDIQARLEADQERYKKIMSKYVIRRPGKPNDIANMVLFLASDASEWITGQTYPVNGGFSFNQ